MLADDDASLMIDQKLYEYIIDKGPTITYEVGDTGELEGLTSIRMFGFRRSFTEPVPQYVGHYFVNSAEMNWEGGDLVAFQPISTPCLAYFKDKALAPSFILAWKATGNGKVYGISLPTDVCVANSDPDKDSNWRTDKDLKSVRLDLIEYVAPVKNKDGFPLLKNLELWMKSHSLMCKHLKVKSVAELQRFLHYDKFIDHFEVTSQSVLNHLKDMVKFELGLGGVNMSNEQKIEYENALNIRKPAFYKVTDMLELHMKEIAYPLEQRVLELNIGMEDSLMDIQAQLLRVRGLEGDQERFYKSFWAMLSENNAAVFTKLKEGTCEELGPASISPLKPLPPLQVDPDEDADNAEVPQNLEFSLSRCADPLAAEDEEEAQPLQLGKRKRSLTSRFMDERGAQPKGKESEQKKETKKNSVTASKADAGAKKRGNYRCLGLYSKDPQKRAQAIAALKGKKASPSPLSPETSAFSTPTFAPKIPSGTRGVLGSPDA